MKFHDYHSLVLAGGGNRCLWQLGFWEVVHKELGLEPKILAGVSAGACMGAVILGDRIQDTVESMKQAFWENKQNCYPKNFLTKKPVFPHYRIYYDGLMKLFDAPTFEKIKNGPELRVLAARFPKGLGPMGSVVLGFFCYTLEKHISQPLHPQMALKAGFKPVIGKLNDCRKPQDAANMILASSATPPFISPLVLDGYKVLDGGLVDNVPVMAIDSAEEPALVLLTRRYPSEKLQGHKGRTYLMPSKPIEICKWDDTDPKKLQNAFDHGKSDAYLFLKKGPSALQV